MSSDGWIKLYRKLQDNPLWTSEPFTRGQAWVDLIMIANHKPGFFFKRNIRINVARGQVGYSENLLASRWKWSRTKVRSFLKLLELEQQISIQKSKLTQIVKILNYEEYQNKVQQEYNRSTTGVPQEYHRSTKNKNVKNEKNNNNDQINGFKFENFWKAYPRKKGKDRARKSWKRYKCDSIYKEIMLSLESHKQSHEWQKDGGKYIPHGSTWVNGKGWEDDVKTQGVNEWE